MDENIIRSLIGRWMTDKEAIIYYALLELWSSPASSISRYLNQNRTTVYTILKRMKERWIVQELRSKKTLYYSVIEPDKLFRDLSNRATAFSSIIPELLNLSKSFDSKPKIQYFEWKKWFHFLMEDILASRSDVRSLRGSSPFYTDEEFISRLSKSAQKYRETLHNNWFVSYRIFWISTLNTHIGDTLKNDKLFRREMRIVENPIFDIKTDLVIYAKDKVSLSFFDDNWIPHILIITNVAIYKTMLSIFKFLWWSWIEYSDDFFLWKKR